MTVRLRLDISYDGSDFSGWATQPGLRTVQETLEEWIAKVLHLPTPARVVCAGRTDAGVHARGQVVHVDLDPESVVRPSRGDDVDLAVLLQRRLRRALPTDIGITRVSHAPANFDARFGAIWRRYCYRLWDHDSVPDPLQRRSVTSLRGSVLDLEVINSGAATLIGLHDFAAFCKKRDGSTTIRTLTECTAHRISDGERAGTIEVWVQADAFCHSMVRSLVGGLVTVGAGKRDIPWLQGLLTSPERSGDISVLPAHGLTLEAVGYPADDQLATRVEQARAVRELP